MNITSKLILTGGPTITDKETEYVLDAIQFGWNAHHSDYLRKFEEAFAAYIGVKHAMATSSCTGALHLALLAMGVGPGDEVIVPDVTWIATVSAVKYVGATPVFADIDPQTWVMDTERIASLVTERTKVIIPVHLYGNPVDMDPLLSLAKNRGIQVLEDAAPSIGAEYKGRKTGSMGHAAAFSFQGAKALVTGEGGMLVSNDSAFMERVRFLNDHGRDPDRMLYNVEIGYKYKMSNLQAAAGLAQVERAEEIVARKRQIFRWYEERLSDVEGIALNVERSWARSIFWMSSIVLGDSAGLSRDAFMATLKERNIDSRPFFYPVSSFPMFEKANNPNAYKVALRGVNLPSGHERTEEEIDYICAHIRDALKVPVKFVSAVQPAGWLSFRDAVYGKLREFKQITSASDNDLPIRSEGKPIGKLRPLTWKSLENDAEVSLLAEWRSAAQMWFPSQFRVTAEGTRRWLDKQVLGLEERILFMVEDGSGMPIGHLGLFRPDCMQRSCELDNVVRGRADLFPGGMAYACRTLLRWTFEELGMKTVYLRVLSDNVRAIKLYEKLGFREIQRMPLRKLQDGQDEVRWADAVGDPYLEIGKYFLTMRLTLEDWEADAEV